MRPALPPTGTLPWSPTRPRFGRRIRARARPLPWRQPCREDPPPCPVPPPTRSAIFPCRARPVGPALSRGNPTRVSPSVASMMNSVSRSTFTKDAFIQPQLQLQYLAWVIIDYTLSFLLQLRLYVLFTLCMECCFILGFIQIIPWFITLSNVETYFSVFFHSLIAYIVSKPNHKKKHKKKLCNATCMTSAAKRSWTIGNDCLSPEEIAYHLYVSSPIGCREWETMYSTSSSYFRYIACVLQITTCFPFHSLTHQWNHTASFFFRSVAI